MIRAIFVVAALAFSVWYAQKVGLLTITLHPEVAMKFIAHVLKRG